MVKECLVSLICKTSPSACTLMTFYKEILYCGLMMMDCFCGMVDGRKAFSLISSRDHCQRSSPSRISDTPRAGFEPAHNLSSQALLNEVVQ